jgi:putative lipoic acid-binding regulatory protein
MDVHRALSRSRRYLSLRVLVAVNNTEQELLLFRKELLKVVPTKVHNKNYVIDASGTRDKLDIIYNDLRDFAKKSHIYR